MGKILIVDDVSINIQMAMNILKNEGHHMFYAQNGKRALELTQKNDFDLILLDIMMPDMDGFDVCAILKLDEKTKDIPIVFLSGKDSTSDIEKAYESGGLDYVVKPFISIELITKSNTYVRLKNLEEKFKMVKG